MYLSVIPRWQVYKDKHVCQAHYSPQFDGIWIPTPQVRQENIIKLFQCIQFAAISKLQMATEA